MTNQEYETELADLLARKAANKREATDLDDMLIALRNRRDNPSYDEMLVETIFPASILSTEPASAFAKRD